MYLEILTLWLNGLSTNYQNYTAIIQSFVTCHWTTRPGILWSSSTSCFHSSLHQTTRLQVCSGSPVHTAPAMLCSKTQSADFYFSQPMQIWPNNNLKHMILLIIVLHQIHKIHTIIYTHVQYIHEKANSLIPMTFELLQMTKNEGPNIVLHLLYLVWEYYQHFVSLFLTGSINLVLFTAHTLHLP